MKIVFTRGRYDERTEWRQSPRKSLSKSLKSEWRRRQDTVEVDVGWTVEMGGGRDQEVGTSLDGALEFRGKPEEGREKTSVGLRTGVGPDLSETQFHVLFFSHSILDMC